MVIVEYTKTGEIVSDWDIDELADSVVDAINGGTNKAHLRYANEHMINAIYLRVLRGEINRNIIQFKFNDQIITVDPITGLLSPYDPYFLNVSSNHKREIYQYINFTNPNGPPKE